MISVDCCIPTGGMQLLVQYLWKSHRLNDCFQERPDCTWSRWRGWRRCGWWRRGSIPHALIRSMQPSLMTGWPYFLAFNNGPNCEISKSASDFFPLANLSQTRSLAARSFVKLLSLLNWRLANLEMFSGIFPVPLWVKQETQTKGFLFPSFTSALKRPWSKSSQLTMVTWGLSKASQTRSKTSFFSQVHLRSLQTTKNMRSQVQKRGTTIGLVPTRPSKFTSSSPGS